MQNPEAKCWFWEAALLHKDQGGAGADPCPFATQGAEVPRVAPSCPSGSTGPSPGSQRETCSSSWACWWPWLQRARAFPCLPPAVSPSPATLRRARGPALIWVGLGQLQPRAAGPQAHAAFVEPAPGAGAASSWAGRTIHLPQQCWMSSWAVGTQPAPAGACAPRGRTTATLSLQLPKPFIATELGQASWEEEWGWRKLSRASAGRQGLRTQRLGAEAAGEQVSIPSSAVSLLWPAPELPPHSLHFPLLLSCGIATAQGQSWPFLICSSLILAQKQCCHATINGCYCNTYTGC